MERFIKGDIVVVPFPFSDLSQSKKRPALVLAELKGDDLILCQITSQQVRDDYAVEIDEKDFSEGVLVKKSNARPNKVFTADSNIILYRAARLKKRKADQIVDRLISLLNS
jgi:mRNA interferase MazF